LKKLEPKGGNQRIEQGNQIGTGISRQEEWGGGNKGGELASALKQSTDSKKKNQPRRGGVVDPKLTRIWVSQEESMNGEKKTKLYSSKKKNKRGRKLLGNIITGNTIKRKTRLILLRRGGKENTKST